jgi:hypothetical protein
MTRLETKAALVKESEARVNACEHGKLKTIPFETVMESIERK